MMEIKLDGWPYPNILTNIRQGGRQHYPRYIYGDGGTVRRNISPHNVFGSVAFFAFKSFLQSGIGKIRESPIPELSDISILENETPDRSPILITGAHSIGHLCSPHL